MRKTQGLPGGLSCPRAAGRGHGARSRAAGSGGGAPAGEASRVWTQHTPRGLQAQVQERVCAQDSGRITRVCGGTCKSVQRAPSFP